MAIEAKRGCGFRKAGGLYLVGAAFGVACHRLPLPLEVCPTCNHGVKQARGWSWVSKKILEPDCSLAPDMSGPACPSGIVHFNGCPVCNTVVLPDRVGLVWIGERFYKTPDDFSAEARQHGISRRVHKIPRGFKLGESWVLLAHPKAVQEMPPIRTHDPAVDGDLLPAIKYKPGIFSVFKPQRIEKILRESDATPEVVAELKERGIDVVKVPDNDKDHQGRVYDKPDAEAND